MTFFYSNLYDFVMTRNVGTNMEEHFFAQVYAPTKELAIDGFRQYITRKAVEKEIMMCDGRIVRAVDNMPRPAKSLNW